MWSGICLLAEQLHCCLLAALDVDLLCYYYLSKDMIFDALFGYSIRFVDPLHQGRSHTNWIWRIYLLQPQVTDINLWLQMFFGLWLCLPDLHGAVSRSFNGFIFLVDCLWLLKHLSLFYHSSSMNEVFQWLTLKSFICSFDVISMLDMDPGTTFMDPRAEE